jgi:NTP pyrophosphatase (non-canonical NTP hydrolase)
MIDKDLKTIADYFTNTQSIKLVEECGELMQALAKWCINPNQTTAKHFIEEMADLDIVLQQVIYLSKNEKYFQKIRKQKIERTLQRIADGTYKK